MPRSSSSFSNEGFTLIELSLVLVIIGLIAGGILVGRGLITASELRSQITQLEKFQGAVTVFRDKYGFLPGDIPNPYAGQFGFATRGSGDGFGDGDWLIAGPSGVGSLQGGENMMFWVDLCKAKLIEGKFTTAYPSQYGVFISGTAIAQYFPFAKIGRNNLYVFNGGYWNGAAWIADGNNYFSLAVITVAYNNMESDPGLTVAQAYALDSKLDDGLPMAGRVITRYLSYSRSNNYLAYSAGGGGSGATGTTATNGSPTTCYDNGGVVGMQNYSLTQNNGSGINCAFSFRFQ